MRIGEKRRGQEMRNEKKKRGRRSAQSETTKTADVEPRLCDGGQSVAASSALVATSALPAAQACRRPCPIRA